MDVQHNWCTASTCQQWNGTRIMHGLENKLYTIISIDLFAFYNNPVRTAEAPPQGCLF